METKLDLFPRSGSGSGKLYAFLGMIILAISLSFSVAFMLAGFMGAVILLLALLAPLSAFLIVRYPKFGIIIYLVLSYLIMYVLGFGIDFPLGTVMDSILLLLIIGFFINQKQAPNWKMFKNPVTIIIGIWIFYNILQVANPTAESRLAWLYTIRSVAGIMLSYFIFSYQINSVKFIRLIIKVWLILSTVAALYAIKQEYYGFFDYEQRALDSNPLLQSLLFINGHWRKSSIFSDPVAFSYNMVVSSTLCICLMFGPVSNKQRVLLAFLAMLFLNVMLYSGTRAAYLLVPAAMVLLFILKFNKRVLVIFAGFSFFLFVLVFMPTSNNSLIRFQSAFRPSDDASYNVRAENQKRIQPYIRSHPLGGGLGATGVWGVRFAPYSFLAQFPPDSGYVRVAVELGFIGLFLICTLFFIVMKTGIENYFKIKDPELKTYCLAMILIIFAISVGNFPQEAIVQFPLSVYFYMFIAMLNITWRLDQQKQEETLELRTTKHLIPGNDSKR
jgi:putative inorganic carbon (HCO3(-)) transporter